MEIITYKKNDIVLDVRFSKENNTIWMSQNDMAKLFSRDVRSINEQLSKFSKNEATFRKFRIVAQDGKERETKHYNLDIIKK